MPVPNVQRITPDDGQRNCPKHVEFHAPVNFGNWCIWLVFCKEICYDERSHERKIIHHNYVNSVDNKKSDSYNYTHVVAICNVVRTYYWLKFTDVPLWIENFDTGYLYAYVYIILQHHINKFYSVICQHPIICSIHSFLFIAAIIYFKYCILKFCALILYSFVLMSAWRRLRFVA